MPKALIKTNGDLVEYILQLQNSLHTANADKRAIRQCFEDERVGH